MFEPTGKYGIVLALLGAAVCLRYLLMPFLSPLRSIPGPLLARFTRLWELRALHRGDIEAVTIDLHRRHGNVVRLAPNRYSIIDPQAAKDIYAISSNFTKSAFYDPFGPPLVNRKDVFSTRIDRHHQEDRRKTASMYSLTSLLSYEPYIDSSNAALCEKMQGFAQTNQPFNLMQWSQFYAFDVIGEITFGKAFGMMETGSDVDGILKTIHLTAFIPSYLGLLPELSNLFYRALSFLVKESPLLSLQTFGARALAERKNGRAPSDREDFLAKCQKLNEAGKLDDRLAGQVPTGNVIAGSDTTGITLAAALYHLIRNPDSMRKLQHELDEATHRGELSQAATYAEATKLPYLQAVIKETLRIHPAVGTILPRVVPAGGKQLAGYYFPEGSVVGVNAWAIHRNPEIFGSDADIFRPERWMGPREEVAIMEQHNYAFGAGSRTCLGKHISLLEINKVLPQLFRRFDFERVDDRAWTTANYFFVKPSYMCRVKVRDGNVKV